MNAWQFANGGLARQEGLTAPTYNDVFTDFGGLQYMTGYDPALATTLNAAGAGGLVSGLGAFLSSGNDMKSVNSMLEGGAGFNDEDMKGVAAGLGIDTGGRSGRELQDYLDTQLKDYMLINGLSEGWNPTGNARGANGTIYKREGGKLVPYQTRGYVAPEEGSWLEEHPGILAPLAVMTGGLAYGALGGGAGATAGGGAAAGGGATAGGLGGGLSSFWSSLPTWGQGMLSGAGQGAISSGLQGGNILQGALRGAVSGGVGGAASGFLGSAGVPSGLASLGGRVAGGLAGNLAGGLMQGSGRGSAGSAEGGIGYGGGEGLESPVGGSTALGMAGGAGGVGFNPMGVGLGNDLRQQLIAKQLASSERAGDTVADNPLVRALRSA